MNTLFNFSRGLPAPFDKLTNKIVAVSSKYGSSTQSTLNCTTVKAIMAYVNCQHGGQGAVGLRNQQSIAEYKSSMGPDAYHIVVYDSSNGQFLAGCYDRNTELIESYAAQSRAKDGAALVFAMMPFLLNDLEFKQNYDAYAECYSKGHPDIDAAAKYMGTLCDNVYRRVSDPACPAHLPVTLEKSGVVLPIRSAQLDAGKFEPKTVCAGEFLIFTRSSKADSQKPVPIILHKDFIGKYTLNPNRKLTPTEQTMIPQIPEWHIITEEVVDICKHAQHSTGSAAPMRNFLLRGPAGTGKTYDAKAVAAGLGLPYVKYTCSSDTDVFDFIGQVYPSFEETSAPEAETELKQIEKMGGITYENVMKLLDMPDSMDMDFDPEGSYFKMTGQEKTDASVHDCMSVALKLLMKKTKQLTMAKYKASSSGPQYHYFETDFILGLKNGYVIEIQEPANITQPSVLTGLNDLLEQSGTILLPNKKRIRRHSDAVIVVTTNIDYEGCRPLNQSVLDRMNKIKDIPLPSETVMVQRVMNVTGCDDYNLVSVMVRVVRDMEDYCHKNGIQDGSVGMRGLIDWVVSYGCTGNAYTSALDTVVGKATADKEEQQALITTCLEPYFSPKGTMFHV